MENFLASVVAKYNYWVYITLMMIGLFAMIAKINLVKKIIGMSIFQTAIMLYYISIGAKKGATIPIVMNAHGPGEHAIKAIDYINPLPHVLMLTAIVVSVATLGVALSLAIILYQRHRTLNEDEILAELNKS